MPDDARITRDRRAEGLESGQPAANRNSNHPYVFDGYIGAACLRCGLEMNHHLHCGPFGPGITKEHPPADVLSAAQRLIEQWRAKEQQLCRQADGQGQTQYAERLASKADGFGTCADQLAALLSDLIPPTEETDASQRYSRTSGPAGPEASPLSPANTTVFSDYWKCATCGAVLYSPTTGRADGVPCWKCSHVPLIIGERQPTIWVPVAKPSPQSAYAVWCEIRKGLVGRLADHELAAADIAFARVTAAEAPSAASVAAEEPSRKASSSDLIPSRDRD